MAFVLDASITASWFLPDERDPRAVKAFALLKTADAHAPVLWWFELRNLLIVNERRGRIDQTQTQRTLSILAALPIELDHSPNEANILTLARRHGLTIYDAAYLELAQRLGLPVATLDRALAKAVVAEGLALVEA